jgi:hypothetical protein
MRTIQTMSVILALIVFQGLNNAKGSEWKPVGFKDLTNLEVSFLSDGSRVYAWASSPSAFFLLDKGSPLPVQAENKNFILALEKHVTVAGRLVGPAQGQNSESPMDRDVAMPLFVLDGAKAAPITLENKPLAAKGGKIAGAYGGACPYFVILGGESAGLYRLDGTVATEPECPKIGKSVDLCWSEGRLAMCNDSDIWIWTDDEMSKVVNPAGEAIVGRGTPQLMGSCLVMNSPFEPAQVYLLEGSTATTVDFGKDVSPRFAHQFGDSIVVTCETGPRGKTAWEFIELKAGKAGDWKAGKAVKETGSRVLYVLGEVGLIAASDGSSYAWYRVDAKGAKRLSMPKGYETATLIIVAESAGVIVTSIGERGSGFALAVIDAKGKVELAEDDKGKPLSAASMRGAAGADGCYVAGYTDIEIGAGFKAVFRAAK